MKYLAIITLALFIFSCENKGKKAVKEEAQIEESDQSEVQNINFKGTVKSAKDSTVLSMAFILVPGTTIGTMTGPDGKFMISAPEGTKKLAFVMDGYEKANVAVDVDKENDIYLRPKTE
jgi:hypothetical protein